MIRLQVICHVVVEGSITTYNIMEVRGLAFCRVLIYSDDPTTIYFFELSVSDPARKNGYANALLKAAEDMAIVLKASFVTLFVLKGSWMEAWYGRHGYVPLDKCDHQPIHPNCIWMSKMINHN